MWDGINITQTFYINSSHKIKDIIKWAIKTCYNTEPLKSYVEDSIKEWEDDEPEKQWTLEKNIYIEEKENEANIRCFNHLPDISIDKVDIINISDE